MSINSSADRQLGGRLAWMIWFVVTLFVIYKFTTQTGYAVINASVADSLSLSLAQVGLLGSVYTFAFAAMTVPTGALLDRYGARITLTAAAGLIALGALLFGFANSWAMVVTGQFLMGVGGAFGFPGGGYVIRHWFPLAQFGIIFGLFEAAVCVNTAFLQGTIGYLIVDFDWRTIMFFGAIIGLILMTVMPLLLRDPDEVLKQSTVSSVSFWRGFYLALKEVAVNKTMWIASISGGMAWGIQIAVAVLWGMKILIARGFDETTASTINATIWVGFAAGAPLVAVFFNTVKSYKIPAYTFTVGLLLAILTLLFSPSLPIWAAFALFFITGVFATASLIAFTITTEICRDVVAGTALAFVNMVMFAVAGFMISIPAKMLDNVELTVDALKIGLLALPGSLLLALVMLLFLREVHGTGATQSD